MREVAKLLKDNGGTPPILRWDIVTGLTAANGEPGQRAIKILREQIDPDGPPFEQVTVNPVQAMELIGKGPDLMVVFMLNSHLFLDPANPAVLQAVWNLRDLFKAKGCCWIGLAPSSAPPLPAELVQDVVVFDEPLPDDTQLGAVVSDVFKSAGLEELEPTVHTKATESLSGLSSFLAEQVTAISLTESGLLDLSILKENHRQTIEQTRGLSVWRGLNKFDDMGGCENAKTYLRRVLAGRNRPRVIAVIEEGEKMFAGNSTDSSGVSQELLGTFLTAMQDNEWSGIICVGMGGTGKSELAKCMGNEGDLTTIYFDLTAMKSSLVGSSGSNLRAALKVVSAIGQKQVFFIMTCNALASIPGPLRRRFAKGIVYFDLPGREEKDQIWDIYYRKYELGKLPRPTDDTDWTGAEIKSCASMAWEFGCSPAESAAYIVPIAKSGAADLERLRQMASGKFIDAGKPGIYQYRKAEATETVVGRRIALGDVN
jgi:hypothetical protein